MNNEELLKKALQEIETLRKEVDSLKSVSNLPIQIERTFMGRGFLNSDTAESIDILDWDSLNETIPITVDTEEITVLGRPVLWLKLKGTDKISAIDLYIPVYGLVNGL